MENLSILRNFTPSWYNNISVLFWRNWMTYTSVWEWIAHETENKFKNKNDFNEIAFLNLDDILTSPCIYFYKDKSVEIERSNQIFLLLRKENFTWTPARSVLQVKNLSTACHYWYQANDQAKLLFIYMYVLAALFCFETKSLASKKYIKWTLKPMIFFFETEEIL